MTKQEFIVKTLKPCFIRPSIRGVSENGQCMYLTKDDKKCAVGSWMKKGEWQYHQGTVYDLFEKYGEEEFLRKEACGILSPCEWQAIQVIHDEMDIDDIEAVEYSVGVDLTELKQLL